LRRRQLLVSKRTALILSSKNQYARNHGKTLKLSDLKSMDASELAGMYDDVNEALGARLLHEQIESLNGVIDQIEKHCWRQAGKLPGYRNLKSLPGIGLVLSGVIMLEVGDIGRFKSPECYASYCRTVAAKKKSNGKTKGDNNRKCGNKYLGWAYIEAANLARRFDQDARRWFDRKAAKRGKIIATKALACKLAKATWHILRNGGSYDAQRLFGAST
jgi:transposase